MTRVVVTFVYPSADEGSPAKIELDTDGVMAGEQLRFGSAVAKPAKG